MTEYAGKWKALATDYIHNAGFIETVMKHQVTLGKIYRSALREQVESLGHEVEETGKNGSGRLRVSRKRSGKNIPPVAGKFRGRGGRATLRSRDVAAKDTRRAKVDPSRLRLMERWLGQMKEKGFDLKAYQESVVPRDAGLRETPPQPERVSPVMPVRAEPGRNTTRKGHPAEKSPQVDAAPAVGYPARQPEPQQPDSVSQSSQTLTQNLSPGRTSPPVLSDTEIRCRTWQTR
jgi:hypothetical protein